MAKFEKDRFDESASDVLRVGAHRAPKSKGSGWFTVLWAALATAALVGAGVIGMSFIRGGLNVGDLINPSASTTAPPTDVVVVVNPVYDPGVSIRVLNATPNEGLQDTVRDELTAAGWSVVTVATAADTTFETTTVYYSSPEYEPAARGLAEALGGVPVALSDAFAGLPITVALGADFAVPAA